MLGKQFLDVEVFTGLDGRDALRAQVEPKVILNLANVGIAKNSRTVILVAVEEVRDERAEAGLEADPLLARELAMPRLLVEPEVKVSDSTNTARVYGSAGWGNALVGELEGEVVDSAHLKVRASVIRASVTVFATTFSKDWR